MKWSELVDDDTKIFVQIEKDGEVGKSVEISGLNYTVGTNILTVRVLMEDDEREEGSE